MNDQRTRAKKEKRRTSNDCAIIELRAEIENIYNREDNNFYKKKENIHNNGVSEKNTITSAPFKEG